jgi:hypothetical protein
MIWLSGASKGCGFLSPLLVPAEFGSQGSVRRLNNSNVGESWMNNGCWISVKRQMKDKKQAGGKVRGRGTIKGLCTSEPDEAFGRAHPWRAGQGQVRFKT